MSSVAQLQVELDLDSGTFTGKVTQAGQLIRSFDSDIGRAAQSLKNIESRTTSWNSSLRGLVTTIDHTRGALRAVWDLTGEWAVDILKVSGELERMQALMRGLSKETDTLKRSQDGIKSMDFLIGMSQNTPFQMSALTDAFVKMKSAGIDPMNGSLMAVTDSVAKFGGNSETLKHASIAIQQMAGKGVISMEELRRQLGEAVPDAIQNMADGLGLSMKDLVKRISSGTVEAKSALERMFFQMKMNNQGASDEMMKTWSGMMSRLESQIMLTKDAIAKAGFTEAVESQLKELGTFLNSNEGKEFANNLGQSLTSVTHAIGEMIQFMRSNWDVIKTTGEILLAAFAATKITSGIISIGSAIGGIANMFATYSKQVVANQAKVDAVYLASARNYQVLMTQAATQKAAAVAADEAAIRKGQFQSTAFVAMKKAEAVALREAAAASEVQAATVARSAGVIRTASTIMQAALGPIGWITLALTVGLSAWSMWGDAAEDGMKRARDAVRKGFATGDDVNQISKQIGLEAESLKNTVAYVTHLKAQLNDSSLSESKRNDIQAELDLRLRAVQALGDHMLKLNVDYETGRRQVEDEGIRDSVSATAREWDSKLAEIARGQQADIQAHKQALKDKNLDNKEYSKQFTEMARADAEKVSTTQKTYITDQLTDIQTRFAALKDKNTAEARQLDEKRKQAEQRLASINSDLNQGQKIGVFDELKGKKTPKKLPEQEAFDSFFTNLKSKVADAIDDIAGMNGEWAKFMSQYESGKYGQLSASQLDGVHKLLDAQKDLTEQLKARKEAETALKKVVEDRDKIESRLTADMASAKNDLTGDIYSSATNGMVGLNRELQTMYDSLVKNANEWNVLRLGFSAFAEDARAQQSQIDASKFSKDMQQITAKSNAAMILDDKTRAHAELQIEIDKINNSVEASRKGSDDEIAIAQMTSAARMAIAAKTAEFEFNNRPAWQKLLDGWSNLANNMNQVWANSMQTMSDHLNQFVETGKLDFKGMMVDILKQIETALMNKAIAQFANLIIGMFGGGATGGFDMSTYSGATASGSSAYNLGYTGHALGGVFGPKGSIPLNKYANGGIATKPQMALFGEGRMPEAYVPLPDGRRIPVAMQGGGQSLAPPITVQVNVINQTGKDADAEQKNSHFDGESLVLDVVLSATNRPGKFRDGMRAGLSR